MQEKVNCADVCALILINEYLKGSWSVTQKFAISRFLLKFIKNKCTYFQQETDGFTPKETKSWTFLQFSLKLKQAFSSNDRVAGEVLVEKLQEEVESLIESPHALHMFFLGNGWMLHWTRDTDNSLELPELLQGAEEDEDDEEEEEERVDPKSELGMFIRKKSLYFQKTFFTGLSSLFSELLRFTNHKPSSPGAQLFSLANLSSLAAPSLEFNEQEEATEHEAQDEEEEAEKEEAGEEEEVGSKYGDIIQYIKSREYDASVRAIHNYFDHCVHDGLVQVEGVQGNRNLLPYSTLHLAILHFSFGEYEEAMQAIKETIRIAQERHENECLTTVLPWLYHIISATPVELHLHLSAEHLLSASITRSLDLKLHYLSALNYLSISKHNLLHADSKYNNLLQSSSTDTGSTWSSVWRGSHSSTGELLADKKRHAALLSMKYLVKSSCWQFYGNKHMQSIYSQLPLELSPAAEAQDSSLEQNCLAFCKLASEVCYSLFPIMEAAANCSAQYFEEGNYRRAFEALLAAREYTSFTATESVHVWLHSSCAILHDLAVYRGHYQLADLYATQLRSLCNGTVELNMLLDVLFSRVTSYMHRGQLMKAIEFLTALSGSFEQLKHLQQYNVTLLLLLGEIHMRAGSTLTALQYLLKSVSLADTHHLHSSKVSATLLLAEVQLQLGHTQKAVNLLHSIHPQLYLHSPLYAQIKATLLQSKCMLARTAPSEVNSKLWTVVDLLKKAERGGATLQSVELLKESYYLQAVVYHLLNSTKERDAAAQMFRKLDSNTSSTSLQPLSAFYYLRDVSIAQELRAVAVQ